MSRFVARGFREFDAATEDFTRIATLVPAASRLLSLVFLPEFDVRRHGKGFDTFLVRHQIDPHRLFDADPTIRLVAHEGTWWLYRRQ